MFQKSDAKIQITITTQVNLFVFVMYHVLTGAAAKLAPTVAKVSVGSVLVGI